MSRQGIGQAVVVLRKCHVKVSDRLINETRRGRAATNGEIHEGKTAFLTVVAKNRGG
jgi:hypothetical protein